MVATDLLKLAWDNLYDTAILVSGDGDFAYAVQAVKDIGKHVEVAAFPANLSWELANVADDREFFTPAYFSDIWNKNSSNDSRRGENKNGPKRRNWRLSKSRKPDTNPPK